MQTGDWPETAGKSLQQQSTMKLIFAVFTLCWVFTAHAVAGDEERKCIMKLCLEGHGCYEENVPCGLNLPKLRCYKINSYDELNWDEARSKCLSMGGKLAEFTDEYSFDYVKKFVWEQKAVFIGGTDQKNEGTWVWNTTGKPVTLKKWTKKPKKPDGGNCMSWWKEEGWDDDLCSIKIGYMCQKDRPHAQGGSCENWLDDTVQGCDPGWVLNSQSKSCYKYFFDEDKKDYNDASHHCAQMGGYVAMPKTEQENRFLHELKPLTNGILLGLTDILEGGIYTWDDGSELNWKYWGSGQPRESAGDCTAMNDYDPRWHAISCLNSMEYFCEKKIDEFTQPKNTSDYAYKFYGTLHERLDTRGDEIVIKGHLSSQIWNVGQFSISFSDDLLVKRFVMLINYFKIQHSEFVFDRVVFYTEVNNQTVEDLLKQGKIITHKVNIKNLLKKPLFLNNRRKNDYSIRLRVQNTNRLGFYVDGNYIGDYALAVNIAHLYDLYFAGETYITDVSVYKAHNKSRSYTLLIRNPMPFIYKLTDLLLEGDKIDFTGQPTSKSGRFILDIGKDCCTDLEECQDDPCSLTLLRINVTYDASEKYSKVQISHQKSGSKTFYLNPSKAMVSFKQKEQYSLKIALYLGVFEIRIDDSLYDLISYNDENLLATHFIFRGDTTLDKFNFTTPKAKRRIFQPPKSDKNVESGKQVTLTCPYDPNGSVLKWSLAGENKSVIAECASGLEAGTPCTIKIDDFKDKNNGSASIVQGQGQLEAKLTWTAETQVIKAVNCKGAGAYKDFQIHVYADLQNKTDEPAFQGLIPINLRKSGDEMHIKGILKRNHSSCFQIIFHSFKFALNITIEYNVESHYVPSFESVTLIVKHKRKRKFIKNKLIETNYIFKRGHNDFRLQLKVINKTTLGLYGDDLKIIDWNHGTDISSYYDVTISPEHEVKITSVNTYYDLPDDGPVVIKNKKQVKVPFSYKFITGLLVNDELTVYGRPTKESEKFTLNLGTGCINDNTCKHTALRIEAVIDSRKPNITIIISHQNRRDTPHIFDFHANEKAKLSLSKKQPYVIKIHLAKDSLVIVINGIGIGWVPYNHVSSIDSFVLTGDTTLKKFEVKVLKDKLTVVPRRFGVSNVHPTPTKHPSLHLERQKVPFNHILKKPLVPGDEIIVRGVPISYTGHFNIILGNDCKDNSYKSVFCRYKILLVEALLGPEDPHNRVKISRQALFDIYQVKKPKGFQRLNQTHSVNINISLTREGYEIHFNGKKQGFLRYIRTAPKVTNIVIEGNTFLDTFEIYRISEPVIISTSLVPHPSIYLQREDIPFNQPLKKPLVPGDEVIVRGSPISIYGQFSIRIASNCKDFNCRSNILQVDVVFTSKNFNRRVQISQPEKFEKYHVITKFPFELNERYSIKISLTREGYDIYINGDKVRSLSYKEDEASATNVIIEGNTVMDTFEINRVTDPETPNIGPSACAVPKADIVVVCLGKRVTDVNRVKAFAKRLFDNADIESGDIRAGVYFGKGKKGFIKSTTYKQNKWKFFGALDRFKFQNGGMKPIRLLRALMRQVFKPPFRRLDVPKYAIVVTDKVSMTAKSQAKALQVLKRAHTFWGIHITTVGVGLTNPIDLSSLATNPYKNSFNIENFADLRRLRNNMVEFGCIHLTKDDTLPFLKNPTVPLNFELKKWLQIGDVISVEGVPTSESGLFTFTLGKDCCTGLNSCSVQKCAKTLLTVEVQQNKFTKKVMIKYANKALLFLTSRSTRRAFPFKMNRKYQFGIFLTKDRYHVYFDHQIYDRIRHFQNYKLATHFFINENTKLQEFKMFSNTVPIPLLPRSLVLPKPLVPGTNIIIKGVPNYMFKRFSIRIKQDCNFPNCIPTLLLVDVIFKNKSKTIETILLSELDKKPDAIDLGILKEFRLKQNFPYVIKIYAGKTDYSIHVDTEVVSNAIFIKDNIKKMSNATHLVIEGDTIFDNWMVLYPEDETDKKKETDKVTSPLVAEYYPTTRFETVPTLYPGADIVIRLYLSPFNGTFQIDLKNANVTFRIAIEYYTDSNAQTIFKKILLFVKKLKGPYSLSNIVEIDNVSFKERIRTENIIRLHVLNNMTFGFIANEIFITEYKLDFPVKTFRDLEYAGIILHASESDETVKGKETEYPYIPTPGITKVKDLTMPFDYKFKKPLRVNDKITVQGVPISGSRNFTLAVVKDCCTDSEKCDAKSCFNLLKIQVGVNSNETILTKTLSTSGRQVEFLIEKLKNSYFKEKQPYMITIILSEGSIDVFYPFAYKIKMSYNPELATHLIVRGDTTLNEVKISRIGEVTTAPTIGSCVDHSQLNRTRFYYPTPFGIHSGDSIKVGVIPKNNSNTIYIIFTKTERTSDNGTEDVLFDGEARISTNKNVVAYKKNNTWGDNKMADARYVIGAHTTLDVKVTLDEIKFRSDDSEYVNLNYTGINTPNDVRYIYVIGTIPFDFELTSFCFIKGAFVLWTIIFKTSNISGAGTDARVSIKLFGTVGSSKSIELDNPSKDDFQIGATDIFQFTTANIGTLKNIEITCSKDSSFEPAWHIEKIDLMNKITGKDYTWHPDTWLYNGTYGGIKYSNSLILPAVALDLGHQCTHSFQCKDNLGCHSGSCDYECLTPGCKAVAELIRNSLDPSVAPCDNFYQFACGGWLQQNSIPESGEINQFKILDEETNDKVKRILKKDATPDDIPPVRSIKNYYKSCIDLKTKVNLNLNVDQPIKVWLRDTMGEWPLLYNHAADRPFDLTKALIKTERLHLGPLIQIWPTRNRQGEREISIDNPYDFFLGKYSRDKYLKGRNDPLLKAYETLIYNIAQTLGLGNPSTAKADVAAIVDFEVRIAENTVTALGFKKFDDDVVMTLAKIHAKYSSAKFNFEVFFKKLLASPGIGINDFPDSEKMFNQAPGYFKTFRNLINTTPDKTLANFVIWRVLSEFLEALPEKYQVHVREFNKVKSEGEKMESGENFCLTRVKKDFIYAVSRPFVDEYFDDGTLKKADQMVKNLKEAFTELLDESDWMDDDTKAATEEKIRAMKADIGYPEWIKNDTVLTKYYENFPFTSNDFFENSVIIKKNEAFVKFSSVIENYADVNVHIDHWETSPLLTIGKYEFSENKIELPAGMLQYPFYNKEFPNYLNYGGIGTFIGHEITHGVDNEGIQVDIHGAKRQWWSDEDVETFKSITDCFVNQYDSFVVDEVNLKVNGTKTLDENIADIVGLKQSFRAYRNLVKQRREKEPPLPRLSYTQNQLFFIHHAQNWCDKISVEAMRRYLKNAVHSPKIFRVIGTMQNSVEFSKTFNCPSGSYMNPPDKCNVW